MAKQFEWISAAGNSGNFVSIDSQQRFYISAGACALIGVPPEGKFSLFLGYDGVNKRIIVAKPDVVKAVDTKPFKFDARRYASARPILRQAAIPPEDLPLRYEYRGKDYSEYPAGAYVFQLVGTDAPDDTGVKVRGK